VGFNAWPIIKAIFQKKLSVVNHDVELEMEGLTKYGGIRNMLRPGVIIALVAVIWMIYHFSVVTQVTNVLMSYDLSLATQVALALLLGALARIASITLRKENEEELTKLEMQKQDERFATFEQAVTSTGSANPKPVSVNLIWSGVKRTFCRNYKRS
jgi:hypothetical protein